MQQPPSGSATGWLSSGLPTTAPGAANQTSIVPVASLTEVPAAHGVPSTVVPNPYRQPRHAELQQVPLKMHSGSLTTETIQKFLEENYMLITTLVEASKQGKAIDNSRYHNKLQQNLMRLASVADSQPITAGSGPSTQIVHPPDTTAHLGIMDPAQNITPPTILGNPQTVGIVNPPHTIAPVLSLPATQMPFVAGQSIDGSVRVHNRTMMPLGPASTVGTPSLTPSITNTSDSLGFQGVVPEQGVLHQLNDNGSGLGIVQGAAIDVTDLTMEPSDTSVEIIESSSLHSTRKQKTGESPQDYIAKW